MTAFSRFEAGKKVYVQDRVQENRKQISQMLIGNSASFYICGRASMSRDIGKEISEVIRAQQQWNETDVRDWVESMKRKRKWQEDVW